MRRYLPIAIFVAAITLAVAAQHHGKSQPKPPPHSGGSGAKAYMQVTGQKQGKFRGAGRSKSDNIPVYSLQISTGSSTDKKTGHASGKKPSQRIQATIDAVDMREFQSAMSSHEVLTEVDIALYSPSGAGQMRETKVIKLSNVTVTHLNVSMQGGKHGMHETESLTLDAQKISYTYANGKNVSQDSWQH